MVQTAKLSQSVSILSIGILLYAKLCRNANAEIKYFQKLKRKWEKSTTTMESFETISKHFCWQQTRTHTNCAPVLKMNVWRCFRKPFRQVKWEASLRILNFTQKSKLVKYWFAQFRWHKWYLNTFHHGEIVSHTNWGTSAFYSVCIVLALAKTLLRAGLKILITQIFADERGTKRHLAAHSTCQMWSEHEIHEPTCGQSGAS